MAGLRGKKNKPKRTKKTQKKTQRSGQPFTGFGGTFIVEEEEEQSRARKTKGASQLTLGQKYSGRRKTFVILAAVLFLSLFLGLLNMRALGGKLDASDVKEQVEKTLADSRSATFPTGEAQLWGERFLRVWGTWDSQTVAGRAAALSPYIAPGMDAQAGWNGQGKQQVIYSSVSSDPKVINSSRAILSGTYQIQDGTWRCVDIPVFAYQPQKPEEGPQQWGFSATANPTPRPCSLQVSVPAYTEISTQHRDQKAEKTLQEQFFPGFFSAWAISDTNVLTQYVSPNIKTFGLGGAFTSDVQVTDVVLPITQEDQGQAAPDKLYSAYVTVTLKDQTGSALSATYEVPVISSGTQWQVAGEPVAIPQNLGGVGGGRQENTRPVGEKEKQKYDEGQTPQSEQPEGVELGTQETEKE